MNNQLSFTFEDDAKTLTTMLNHIIKECRLQRRVDRSDLKPIKDFIISTDYHDIYWRRELSAICLLEDNTTCRVWLLEKALMERTWEKDIVYQVVRKKFRDWRGDGRSIQVEPTLDVWLEQNFEHYVLYNGVKFKGKQCVERYKALADDLKLSCAMTWHQ